MPRKNSSSKRFGARYGSKTRRNVDEAEKRNSKCKECGEKLTREAAGIWKCRGCGKKVSGGSYKADTGAEEMLNKALQVGTEELEEAQDIVEGDQ